MTHTDTDIAEMLQRFDERFEYKGMGKWVYKHGEEIWPMGELNIKNFITRECLALKKKWEREHFDNQ